jgi:hypothetical protein
MMRGALLAAGLAALLAASTAQAQMPGPNLAPPPLLPSDTQPQAAIFTAAPQAVDERVAFNSSERWIIPTFYERVREKQRRAARNKKYERTLPAGITAVPAKGDLLPMTVLARLDRLPGALLRSLPPARPQTDRVMVGKDILMVSTSTGEVLDVLPNILY